jgi:thiol:disulfide interchange protein DsbD
MELSGNIFDYFIVFWSGVLVSFTPCVYPLIPITASFIAGFNAKGTKLMGLFLSLIYVLGLAVTYCALAVFAAMSGKVFGQFQNNPWIYIGVANVLLFFALVMFDVIHLPSFGFTAHHHIKRRGILTVFLFGLASGLVIGPCTAPVLGTLLLYVASKQNITHGISLLFVFSYGLGASLIIAGTFVGILESLPKSGKWLVWVKRLCGVVLLIAVQYFLLKAGGLL